MKNVFLEHNKNWVNHLLNKDILLISKFNATNLNIYYCQLNCRYGKIFIARSNDCIVYAKLYNEHNKELDPINKLLRIFPKYNILKDDILYHNNTNNLNNTNIYKNFIYLVNLQFNKIEQTIKISLATKSDLHYQTLIILLRIPYGKSVSYSEVANQTLNPKAIRAVSSLIGLNPILILIPCHRVISKSGKIGGFSDGIKNKKKLIKQENIKYKL